jgi:hypothetical protein
VSFYLADLLIAAVLVAVGCVLTYVSVRRALKLAVSELQLGTDRQFNVLANTLKTLEARVAALNAGPIQAAAMPPAVVSVSAPAATKSATAPGAKVATPPQQEEIPTEILVTIAAAVTVFLGKKVRIRSAKMLQSPYEIVNPWSQQGRVFVQASHNLRSRG